MTLNAFFPQSSAAANMAGSSHNNNNNNNNDQSISIARKRKLNVWADAEGNEGRNANTKRQKTVENIGSKENVNKPQVFPSLPFFPDQNTIASRRRRDKRCEYRTIHNERRARQTRSDEERRKEHVKLHKLKNTMYVEELSWRKLRPEIPRQHEMPLGEMMVNTSIRDTANNILLIAPCALCHQKILRRHEAVYIEKCGHRYHRTCICNWIADVNKCPLCYNINTTIYS